MKTTDLGHPTSFRALRQLHLVVGRRPTTRLLAVLRYELNAYRSLLLYPERWESLSVIVHAKQLGSDPLQLRQRGARLGQRSCGLCVREYGSKHRPTVVLSCLDTVHSDRCSRHAMR